MELESMQQSIIVYCNLKLRALWHYSHGMDQRSWVFWSPLDHSFSEAPQQCPSKEVVPVFSSFLVEKMTQYW